MGSRARRALSALPARRCFRLSSFQKQGVIRGHCSVEQRQAEKGVGGPGRELASRGGGLPHLPRPGRARHRAGPCPGAAPSGPQSGSMLPSGTAASLSWAVPSLSTAASPAARQTRSPTAPAASAWPCAALKSKKAATSPPTASSSRPSATRVPSPSSTTSLRTKKTTTASWARCCAATTPPPPALPKSSPKPCSKRCWPSAARAANSPAHGSATPSTASTTASAPSSASSPASPAQPRATANTCCSPGSPA
jgi:hypothetical protein